MSGMLKEGVVIVIEGRVYVDDDSIQECGFQFCVTFQVGPRKLTEHTNDNNSSIEHKNK